MGRGRSTLGMIIIALLMLNDGHITLPNIKKHIKQDSKDPFRNGIIRLKFSYEFRGL